jgi:transposase-like protein
VFQIVCCNLLRWAIQILNNLPISKDLKGIVTYISYLYPENPSFEGEYMSTIPILNNTTFLLKSPDIEELQSCVTSKVIDQLTETRIILDLIGKGTSPHELQDHFHNVYRLARKYHAIRKIVSQKAKKARRINTVFDLLACQTLLMIEMDETFKGSKVSLLVVADSVTGYIFMICWLPRRSKNELISTLTPIKDLFSNVKLVLTDGAPYFPDVVKDICPNAKHQRCLIHILRNLFPHFLPQKQAYHHAILKVQNTQATYADFYHKHIDRQKQWDALKHQEKYWKNKRIHTQNTLGVKPYQKKINHHYPELKAIYDKVNHILSQIRSLKNTLDHDRSRLPLLKEDIEQAKRWKNTTWNIYMALWKTLHRFYNLFLSSAKHFEAKKQKYLTQLVNTPANDLTKAIMRLLTDVKDLSTVYTEDCPIRLNRSFINTNVIESINSRLRPILDKLKKLCNTPYLSDYLEIIRLRMNASPPYAGSRSKMSPIEQWGYNLKFRTWIDLILNGMPPGRQPSQNLDPFKMPFANPKRFVSK